MIWHKLDLYVGIFILLVFGVHVLYTLMQMQFEALITKCLTHRRLHYVAYSSTMRFIAGIDSEGRSSLSIAKEKYESEVKFFVNGRFIKGLF